MSKWYITKLVFISLLGLILHEVSNLIYYIDPRTENIYPKHLYLSKSYEQPKISVLYFFYELVPYIDNLIKSVVLYSVAGFIAVKLRKVAFWFCVLYVTQIYYYLYDRNTSFLANITLYTIIAVICIIVIYPAKRFPKLRRIK